MRDGVPRDDGRSCPSGGTNAGTACDVSVIDGFMFSLTATLMVSEPHGDSVFESGCDGIPLF